MNAPAIAPAVPPGLCRLPGGERVQLCAIAPSDGAGLQAYVRGLSCETRYNRFFGAVTELAPAELDRLTHMDRPDRLVLVGHAGAAPGSPIIAEAILVLEPDGHRCEIALSIADAWQGRGLGTVVLRDLEARARRLGARCLVGEILRSNAAMKGLARKAGFAFAGPLRDARLTAIREAAGRRGWCGAGARPDIAPRKRG